MALDSAELAGPDKVDEDLPFIPLQYREIPPSPIRTSSPMISTSGPIQQYPDAPGR